MLRRNFGAVHAVLAAKCSTAQYARAVFLEDVAVNSVLAGCAPLALSSWRGRTGLSRLPPLGEIPGGGTWAARRVEINPVALGLYARSVHAATDAYLRSLAAAPDRLAFRVLTAVLQSEVRVSGGKTASAQWRERASPPRAFDPSARDVRRTV